MSIEFLKYGVFSLYCFETFLQHKFQKAIEFCIAKAQNQISIKKSNLFYAQIYCAICLFLLGFIDKFCAIIYNFIV